MSLQDCYNTRLYLEKFATKIENHPMPFPAEGGSLVKY